MRITSLNRKSKKLKLNFRLQEAQDALPSVNNLEEYLKPDTEIKPCGFDDKDFSLLKRDTAVDSQRFFFNSRYSSGDSAFLFDVFDEAFAADYIEEI